MLSAIGYAWPGPIEWIILLAVFLCYAVIVFLPAIVAYARRARHRRWILGLSFVALVIPPGMLALLIWACLDERAGAGVPAFEVQPRQEVARG